MLSSALICRRCPWGSLLRKFWKEYDGGGSACARTEKISKEKGGFMLHDSLVVLLQKVVAARLVHYFHGHAKHSVEIGAGSCPVQSDAGGQRLSAAAATDAH